MIEATEPQTRTVVRRALEDDLDALVAMGCSFLEASPYAGDVTVDPTQLGPVLASLATRDDALVLVAVAGDAILGGIVAVLTAPWFAPATIVAAELAWWVAPEHRGGSVGLRLLRQFEAWARERQARPVLSDLVSGGGDAGGYASMGYRMTERTWIRSGPWRL